MTGEVGTVPSKRRGDAHGGRRLLDVRNVDGRLVPLQHFVDIHVVQVDDLEKTHTENKYMKARTVKTI